MGSRARLLAGLLMLMSMTLTLLALMSVTSLALVSVTLNVSDVILPVHVVVGGLHTGYLNLSGTLLVLTNYPVSCIEAGLAICFTYDNIHVSMPFSQVIPPSPSSTESKRQFYTSVSLLLSCIQGYRYHLSKFHIYVLVYCIGVFLSGLLHSV